mmetsp:Transcript_21762/g.47431  ORF Transcript_21762/g.47431 Transcript_21762/m.47431 type:complete len:95 (+) Transcript_21762:2920-3204(+)
MPRLIPKSPHKILAAQGPSASSGPPGWSVGRQLRSGDKVEEPTTQPFTSPLTANADTPRLQQSKVAAYTQVFINTPKGKFTYPKYSISSPTLEV